MCALTLYSQLPNTLICHHCGTGLVVLDPGDVLNVDTRLVVDVLGVDTKFVVEVVGCCQCPHQHYQLCPFIPVCQREL